MTSGAAAALAAAAAEDAAAAELPGTVDDDAGDDVLVTPMRPDLRASIGENADEIVRLADNLRLAVSHEYARAVTREIIRAARAARDALLHG